MRSHSPAVVLLLWCGLVCAQPAQAQTKQPVAEAPAPKLVYEQAAQPQDLKHGTLIALTLDDESATKLTGTLVRWDNAKKRLFVRSEAQVAPKAVEVQRIKRFEIAATKRTASADGIQLAAFREAAIRVQPEIHRMAIYQGAAPEVHYFAPRLSEGEQTRLTELEEAENELARLEAVQVENAVAREANARWRAERMRTLQLLNSLLFQQVETPYPPYPYPPYPRWLSGAVVQLQIDEPPPPPMEKAVNPEVLARARAKVREVQSRAVYEEGRLIAVVTDK